MARIEKFKVTFVAPGVHHRVFRDADDAIKFIADLDPGAFMGYTNIVENDMPTPKQLRIQTEAKFSG